MTLRLKHLSPDPTESIENNTRSVRRRLSKSRKPAIASGFLVGVHGLEPWTSSVSRKRSSQLSYTPGVAQSSRPVDAIGHPESDESL